MNAIFSRNRLQPCQCVATGGAGHFVQSKLRRHLRTLTLLIHNRNLQRYYLIVEMTAADGVCCALLRQHPEPIRVVARNVILLRKPLRPFKLTGKFLVFEVTP